MHYSFLCVLNNINNFFTDKITFFSTISNFSVYLMKHTSKIDHLLWSTLSVVLIALPYIKCTHYHVLKDHCNTFIHRVKLHFVLTEWMHTLTFITVGRQWKLCVVWERSHCYKVQNINVPLLSHSLHHLQELSILGKNINCKLPVKTYSEWNITLLRTLYTTR
jgi:hypothetical protein